jgi:hypothetical protein
MAPALLDGSAPFMVGPRAGAQGFREVLKARLEKDREVDGQTIDPRSLGRSQSLGSDIRNYL